ncbi:MAG: hypothetical protein KF889_17290 [Alphaproteobacteria bacterium]|nr:hypothetical protein [Alphaproteobacteria bacterium]MCW5739875.1 hypothetical protein [Alphaproteobacteria bacterium]
MRAMSGFLALATAGFLASGCGPAMRWDRPGTSAEMLQADQLECRKAAADEAFRSYAFHTGFGMMGAPFWGYRHRPDYFMWRQRLQTERAFYETRLASFCMRNKGYTQVPVNEQAPAR